MSEKTPLQLMVAIAHWVTDRPQQYFTPETWNAWPCVAAREELRERGMITWDGYGTEKLKFYIDHLCAQPYPVESFKIPSIDGE